MAIEIDNTLPSWEAVEGQCEWSGLLLGNGFSQNVWARFGYQSLFETASQAGESQLVAEDLALFQGLATHNFEVVLSALSTSKLVAHALGQEAGLLSARESSIRNALIAAVHRVHVPWGTVPENTLNHLAAALANFESIYSTNYDLLVYWSMMRQPASFRDFFWSSEFDITNTEVWGKKTKVHFLHGGLHLYRKPNGQTLKRAAQAGANLLDVFATDFGGALPLFISEGTASEKLASIYRSNYLSFLMSRFTEDASPIVVFGHSLGESDTHILDILRSRPGREIAVSMRPGGNIVQRKAGMIEELPDAQLTFFEASTHPLGRPELRLEEQA